METFMILWHKKISSDKFLCSPVQRFPCKVALRWHNSRKNKAKIKIKDKTYFFLKHVVSLVSNSSKQNTIPHDHTRYSPFQ